MVAELRQVGPFGGGQRTPLQAQGIFGEHHHDGEEEGTTWKYNESFKIDGGVTAYPINVDITVPKDARHGDYHFMIKVTDLAGWQQLKALAIKIE